MRTDVFPNLNMPVIYVAQAYGGMDSAQMEGLITSYYEMVFLYMNGIDHVESKNIQNLALVKLYFHPGTDMVQAMAEAAIYANRVKAYFPPGTVPPVHHADGRQQRAGLVPGALQRDAEHQRTVRPDAVPGAAEPGEHSRGRGAPAVRRQSADHHRLPRPGANCAPTEPVAAGSGRRPEQRATRSRRRAMPASGTRTRSCRSIRW